MGRVITSNEVKIQATIVGSFLLTIMVLCIVTCNTSMNRPIQKGFENPQQIEQKDKF